MRYLFTALFFISSHCLLSAENKDSTEIPRDRHPLISIGAGIQSGRHLKPGPVYTAGFEYPLNRGRYVNLEFLLWQWHGKVSSENPTAEGIEKSGYGLSIIGRFFFVSDSSDVRPFVHIGGVPVPFYTWDVGVGFDYRLSKDFYAQFCVRETNTIFQGLLETSSWKYFPAMATVSLRYKL